VYVRLKADKGPSAIRSQPSGDVPPTGKHVSADYVAVLRTSGGKITYMRHYFDVMDLMAQLGLVGADAKV
jgi:ketosteroid isomerase-like protein